tara:strand:- start:922 stop:1584 length:663 start_codon:yes stop_codon:yes gene_type:complete
MTIADVLQLPDETEIDRVSGVAECWAQESAESTGGAYTYQNGKFSDNGSVVRLRMNNCIPLPPSPTPVEFCGPGVVKKTFRDETQIYVTGRATVVPATGAPPAPIAPPSAFPTFDPASPPDPTNFPASPTPTAPTPDDLFFPTPATTAPPAPIAPTSPIEYSPGPAGPVAVPNGTGELSDHFVAAVRIALDVCARTGIEFYPELVATIIIDAQRRNVVLK